MLEEENERLKLLLYTKPREVKFKPRNKKKGRGSALRKVINLKAFNIYISYALLKSRIHSWHYYRNLWPFQEQIKQGVQFEQRFAMNEARKKVEEEFLQKEKVKTEDSPKTVLDRFRRKNV